MVNPFDHVGEINSEDRKIWWLASYPKSGNTWVRMFLNCYATRFPVSLNTVFQFVVSDLRSEIYQMMSPRPLSEMSLREQFMYLPGALINLIKMSNTKNIVVKTHNAKAIVEGITLVPPSISAGAVYIIRDPRDVVISLSHHFNITINEAITMLNDGHRAGESKHGLFHMFMSWSQNVCSWTKNNKDVPTLVVKYEELNVAAFEVILKHFEVTVPDHEERLKFAMEQTEFSNLQKQEIANGFVEKAGKSNFFRSGKSGQWKTVLTKKQQEVITDNNKEVMEYYGYI
jgi:hypothetical protein